MTKQESIDSMQVRRITLPDGRYMIFYTFDRDVQDRAATKIDISEQAKEHRSPQPQRGSRV
jgi:hypothetical protein